MMDEIDPAIPDKLYFRIGEVSRLVGVEPYVLRYWESEFKGLSPKKSGTGSGCFGARMWRCCWRSSGFFTIRNSRLKGRVRRSIKAALKT